MVPFYPAQLLPEAGGRSHTRGTKRPSLRSWSCTCLRHLCARFHEAEASPHARNAANRSFREDVGTGSFISSPLKDFKVVTSSAGDQSAFL